MPPSANPRARKRKSAWNNKLIVQNNMAARTWTPAQRDRQREAIRLSQPWTKSTGPKTPGGKRTVSRNAWTGGQLVQLRRLRKMLNEALRASRKIRA